MTVNEYELSCTTDRTTRHRQMKTKRCPWYSQLQRQTAKHCWASAIRLHVRIMASLKVCMNVPLFDKRLHLTTHKYWNNCLSRPFSIGNLLVYTVHVVSRDRLNYNYVIFILKVKGKGHLVKIKKTFRQTWQKCCSNEVLVTCNSNWLHI